MDWTKFWESFSDPNHWNPFNGDNWKSAGAGFDYLTQNGFLGFNDILLPGSSILDNFFDLTGKGAADDQFQHQLELQHDAQNYNSNQAELQRQWEEHMSSTAYQRQAADLEAAGLNPYLALGTVSGGASTPSGSSASSSPGSASMANNKLTAAAGIVALFLKLMLMKH